jgi:hypothetical protein
MKNSSPDPIHQPLPNPKPIPYSHKGGTHLAEADLRDLIRGLSPGWYTSQILHPRYQVWAINNGRKVGGTTSLAKKLRELVGPENVRTLASKHRAYFLSEDLVSE